MVSLYTLSLNRGPSPLCPFAIRPRTASQIKPKRIRFVDGQLDVMWKRRMGRGNNCVFVTNHFAVNNKQVIKTNYQMYLYISVWIVLMNTINLERVDSSNDRIFTWSTHSADVFAFVMAGMPTADGLRFYGRWHLIR